MNYFKDGYYTEEERKKEYIDSYNGFKFKSVLDLSEPIYYESDDDDYSYSELLKATSMFIGMWTKHILPHLDRFSGFNTLKFKIKDHVLKNSVVKKYIKDNYQKRVGKDFLLHLEAHIQHKLNQAGELHNGTKKTLDSAVAVYVGIGSKK